MIESGDFFFLNRSVRVKVVIARGRKFKLASIVDKILVVWFFNLTDIEEKIRIV